MTKNRLDLRDLVEATVIYGFFIAVMLTVILHIVGIDLW
nr:MAG TPA: hypothetical protein [Caudoviricetes sp.]